jgi:type I restriction enzyme, S subunit
VSDRKQRELPGLPPSWKWATVGQLTDVIRGASPRPKGDPRYFGGDIPWIMIADVTRQPGKYLYSTREHVTKAGAERSRLIAAGELILSNSATVCVPKILKVPGCIHDGFVAFPTLKNEVELDFAYYWFEYVRPIIIQENRQGVTQVNLNTGIVREMHFPLAPRADQRRIVAEIEKQFTRLDAGVAALRRVQTNLKRYRAAVLKAACEGRLVPTEAELARKEGRFYESGEQLLLRILDERRKHWSGGGRQYPEPSDPSITSLRTIPEGWTSATVEQVTRLVATGATPYRGNASYWKGGTIPWVTSGALNEAMIDSAREFITPRAIKETNAKLFPAGTLLIALYGEGKTRGMVSELRLEAATNQACAALLFDHSNEALRPFLKVFLQKNYEDVRLLSSGGVQPNLSLSIVKHARVPFPPVAEQTRIVAEVERRLSVVDELEALVGANLQRAARLRQAILQKAFSGSL